MDETHQMVRPARTHDAAEDPGAVAHRGQLAATRDALADQTRRCEAAHAGWADEARAHETTRAALRVSEAAAARLQERCAEVERTAAEVARVARDVLEARTPRSGRPPVARRLASVLDAVDGAPDVDAEELARRFALVRARLSGERPPGDGASPTG